MKQSVARVFGGVLGVVLFGAAAGVSRAGIKEWKAGVAGDWHEAARSLSPTMA